MKTLAIRRLWPFPKDGTVPQEAQDRAEDAASSQRGKEIAALGTLLLGAAPGSSVQLDDVFVGPRIIPAEHEWYYGAKCRWCYRTAAALHDPNEGQARLNLAGRGEIHFHCHHCNGLLKVTIPKILWFQFEG